METFEKLADLMSAVTWEVVKREEKGDWTRVTYKVTKGQIVIRVFPIFSDTSGSSEFRLKPAGKGLVELRRVCSQSTRRFRKKRDSRVNRKVAGKNGNSNANKRVGKAIQR